MSNHNARLEREGSGRKVRRLKQRPPLRRKRRGGAGRRDAEGGRDREAGRVLRRGVRGRGGAEDDPRPGRAGASPAKTSPAPGGAVREGEERPALGAAGWRPRRGEGGRRREVAGAFCFAVELWPVTVPRATSTSVPVPPRRRPRRGDAVPFASAVREPLAKWRTDGKRFTIRLSSLNPRLVN